MMSVEADLYFVPIRKWYNTICLTSTSTFRFLLITFCDGVDNTGEKSNTDSGDRTKCHSVPEKYHSRGSNWKFVQGSNHANRTKSASVIIL